MSATALVMTNPNPKPNTHKTKFYNGSLKWPLRIVSILVLIALLSTLATIFQVTAQIGLGTMKSEKTLKYTGLADSNLLLGSGVNGTESILGFAPVSTVTAINISGQDAATATATLVGSVYNMKGMPSATGYFRWGYSPTALTNITAPISITGIGTYTTTITGFAHPEVYYSFETDADGTNYSPSRKLTIPSAMGGIILRNMLRLIIAAVILICTLYLGSKNYVLLIIYALMGVAAFLIANTIIERLWV